MRYQRRFPFHRAQPMPGYVEHVVDPPHDPEIAVFIFARTVAGKVRARNLRPILLHVTIRIAVNRPQHGGPRLLDDEITPRAQGPRLAFHGDDFRNHAEERLRGRTWLRGDRARDGCDHDGAGFRLPPCIHDRAAAMADHLAIPDPGLGINRLTDGAEQTQALQSVFFRPLVAPLYERPDSRRSGVEHVDLMAVDNRPETIGLRTIRRPFIHETGGAALQWAVYDVAVPGDPADVGGTPAGVFVAHIKNEFRRGISANRVATGGMHNTLGLSRRAGGGKDVEGVYGIERFRGTVVGAFGHYLMPPVVASARCVDWGSA